VYICRIPRPISRLDSTGDDSNLESNNVLTGRRLDAEEMDFGLLTVPYLTLGVLDAEEFGLWKEYVINKASERRISALRLLITKTENASIKLGKTS